MGLADTGPPLPRRAGHVDLLGRAVLSMRDRLGLDTALNGVPRYPSLLPRV